MLYTTITYGKEFVAEKPVLANICTVPTPGLSILYFPPQSDHGTNDYTVGSLFEFYIFKNQTGVFQISFLDKIYDAICFKADIFRGIRLRTNDLAFWRATLKNGSIFSVTKHG